MPLATCPVDEKTLAEYSLGPGRTRLSAEERGRVAGHVDVCGQCRRDLLLYAERAHGRAYARGRADYDPRDLAMIQNVAARFRTEVHERAKEKAYHDVGRRWRKRAAWMVAGTAFATLAVCFSFA